ncbi:MAG: aldehyde dehydrogenase family protein [Anaerovoracaceae bacterium]|nr:aldehyde dehydrogenase family protein [Anaerovoracaceae bacterium]
MTEQQIEALVSSQRRQFSEQGIPSVRERREALKKLRAAVMEHEAEIAEALRLDLGKSPEESYTSEIGMFLTEINWLIRNINRLAKDRHVLSPLAQLASDSFTSPVPYGTILIISPWNYPVMLTLEPLADAIAAGNTAVIKPSEYSYHVSEVLEKILSEIFPPEQVCVVQGDAETSQQLLKQKFDMIFFTGSGHIGKEVLASASAHMTPVVLELGGKSPCIVDETAKIDLAARRIVFGKFLNCGQTCVAPDYILAQESIAEDLAESIDLEIDRQYGAWPLDNPKYGKIINQKHFERVKKLIDGNIFSGGVTDPVSCRIEPTIIYPASFDDKAMQEEIFGPVLPIITYRDITEIPEILADRDIPLALYIFSQKKKNVRFILDRCRFGGGCVNDTVIHLATPYMGFGGMGASGMGSYHGKDGFEAFSHRRSILNKKTFMDMPLRYQPYSKIKQSLVRFFER